MLNELIKSVIIVSLSERN